jgi:O-antigen/teichoic acid export membrane protein
MVENRKSNLLSNIGVYTIGLFAYYLLQWYTTVAIVRLSGYSDAGILSIVISFCNIFGFVALFGLRNYQICDVEERYSNGEYFSSRILTVGLSLLCFAAVLWQRSYDPQTVLCCIGYMAFKTLEAFSDVFFGVMQRRNRYGQIAVSYFLKGLLPTAVFALLLVLKQGLLAAIIGMTAAYLIVMLAYDLYKLKGTQTFRLKFNRIVPLLKACFPLMLCIVFSAVMVYVPKEAVNRVLGMEAAGYFGTISILIVVFSTLATSVWGVIIPKISGLFVERKQKEFHQLIKYLVLGYILLSIVVLLLGNLLGPWALSLIYGKQILSYIRLLTPVLINSMLLMGVSFFDGLFTALNKRFSLLLCNVAGVLICILLVQQWTQSNGMDGANFAMMAGYGVRLLLLVILSFVYTRQVFREKTENISETKEAKCGE